MDAYFALAACVFFLLMCCAISLAMIQGARADHLEAINAKLRDAIRPFDPDGDGKPGGRKRAA